MKNDVNRIIDSHWAKKHIALKLFNATDEGWISITYLIPVHIFGHWIADVKKKNINPARSDCEKNCDTVQQKWEQVSWAHKFTVNTSKPKFSLSYEDIFQFIVHHYETPKTSLKAPPMLLICRWICFYLVRPENRAENQSTNNLKPRISANTTFTSTKYKVFSKRLLFCSDLSFNVSRMM